MKTIPTFLGMLLICAGEVRAEPDAVEASKTHLVHLLSADAEGLKQSYSAMPRLMPGHEFLKVEYGLTEEPGRKKAIDVDRAKLVQAILKASEGRTERPADEVAAMMKDWHFEVLPTSEGDFATSPADPVGTADSKIHFKVRKGDVLVKVSPRKGKGDFILLQMREVDGAWRVVAESLD